MNVKAVNNVKINGYVYVGSTWMMGVIARKHNK